MLSAGGTFFIACAYGPVDTDTLVTGRVLHGQNGLEDMLVCAEVGSETRCSRSTIDGDFIIDAMAGTRDNAATGFRVCAEDDLDVTSGAVTKTCVDVPPGQAPFSVNIEMEEPVQ